ncbi:hypothetical protein SLEP1_g57935 [Rubroshorea leprosula]|uniref:Uncharacterized protein n=1 Tax=Rubroshorea leprosula TaxID=152421 RepID=A0AAV5MS90_9ROSI|nr:hypothetical protein SLEP1_g57935 [Rubroshorea leprosula]
MLICPVLLFFWHVRQGWGCSKQECRGAGLGAGRGEQGVLWGDSSTEKAGDLVEKARDWGQARCRAGAGSKAGRQGQGICGAQRRADSGSVQRSWPQGLGRREKAGVCGEEEVSGEQKI